MDRADVAFEEVAENELQKHTVNDPARIFLRYISAALDGQSPSDLTLRWSSGS